MLIARLRRRACLPGRRRAHAAACRWGEHDPSPRPAANENLPILGPGKDPATALASVRMILARLRQENARQGMLLADSEGRQAYEECRALERAFVWRYFERGSAHGRF
jgi:hypothetical protein